MSETAQEADGADGAEAADVVVIGARCAGSAVASILAMDGRRVIVLDRARFPSDTLSTHAMFPAGCAEMQRIGVWGRVLDEIDPARLDRVQLTLSDGTEVRERWEPVDGIDFGVSIPRDQLDVVLASNAADQGADVREGCVVTAVTWVAGRASGVVYRDAEGGERRIRARLVIGADGRRSTVAAAVGAWQPYRASRNGRGLVFRYMDDPRAGEWESRTMWQWRDEDSLAFAFPNPRGRTICLFMAASEEVAEARSDPEGYWERKLRQHPGCAERLAGATNMTKIRSTADVSAYWRASSGPGWVLAGDAAHFKDPVTGQGMGDAMRMGRTLGEAIGPILDRPAELDRATRRWEQETARHCLHAYHFANLETVAEPVSPVLRELIVAFSRDDEPGLSHLFGRTRKTEEVLTWPRMSAAFGRVVLGGRHRVSRARDGASLALTWARIRRELARDRFREAGPVPGSDHPGPAIWAPPKTGARRPAAEPTASTGATASAPEKQPA